MAAPDLAERKRAASAGHRSAIGIELEMVSVGTLEVTGGARLCVAQRLLRSVDLRAQHSAGDLPVVAPKPGAAVYARRVGARAQELQVGGEIPMYSSDDPPQCAAAFTEVSLNSQYAVVGERLDRIPVLDAFGIDDQRPFPAGDRIH